MDGATTVAAASSRQADGGHQDVVPTLPARSFRLPHRIVMAPLTRSRRANRAACRVPSPSTMRSIGNPRVDAWPGLCLDPRHPQPRTGGSMASAHVSCAPS